MAGRGAGARRMGYYGRERVTFVGVVSSLVGHIAATAVLFVTIMAVTWGIAWSFAYLDKIHEFPEASQKILTFLEVALLAIDAGLCLILILFGARRFVSELRRIL
jgi:hypothetical protein